MRRFLKWAGLLVFAVFIGVAPDWFGISRGVILTVLGVIVVMYLNNRVEDLEAEVESIRRDLNL